MNDGTMNKRCRCKISQLPTQASLDRLAKEMQIRIETVKGRCCKCGRQIYSDVRERKEEVEKV